MIPKKLQEERPTEYGDIRKYFYKNLLLVKLLIKNMKIRLPLKKRSLENIEM